MIEQEHQNPLGIISPIMTKERFIEYSGVRNGQLRGQLDRDNIPTIKLGKHRLINIAKLTYPFCLFDEMGILVCPAMTSLKFSAASGLTESQVDTALTLRHFPRCEIGRLVLVDVAELYRICQKTPLKAVN